jgi:peptidoglycan/xylan/chitin deacetylase (PgdA/CDA1 family)
MWQHPLVLPHARGLPAALTALGMAALGSGVYGTMWPSSQWFGKTLIAGPNPKEVALTFDDGPNGDTTARLLDKLAKYNIKATFFLVGKYVLAQPELARRIVAQGHAVGNHSMTHPRLLMLGPAATRNEIADAQKAIADTTGVAPKMFRPPFGGRWPYTLGAARQQGLVPVMWNAMGMDWSQKDPALIAARLLGEMAHNREQGVGSNLLLHDGSHKGIGTNRDASLGAVDRVVKAVASKSKFVTVEAWLPGTETASSTAAGRQSAQRD